MDNITDMCDKMVELVFYYLRKYFINHRIYQLIKKIFLEKYQVNINQRCVNLVVITN